jgi:hypothetical protein
LAIASKRRALRRVAYRPLPPREIDSLIFSPLTGNEWVMDRNRWLITILRFYLAAAGGTAVALRMSDGRGAGSVALECGTCAAEK